MHHIGFFAALRMTRLGVALALGALSATAATPTRTEIFPGVEEIEFRSETLAASRKLTLVLPAPFAASQRPAPVLFLLHGRGRNHRSLVDVPAVRQTLLDAPFCTVLPQGDDGWYVDSPVQPTHRYDAYLTEVIRFVATLKQLDGRKEHRAIAGWSMGGYGAVRYATTHPEAFGVVGSMIGLLDFPRVADLPSGRNYTVPEARFGSDPLAWKRFNPLFQAEALRNHAVCLITADAAFDRVMNENFHARLDALGIPHQYRMLPGGHTFDVVQAALPALVAFVAEHFGSSSNATPRKPSP